MTHSISTELPFCALEEAVLAERERSAEASRELPLALQEAWDGWDEKAENFGVDADDEHTAAWSSFIDDLFERMPAA